MTAVAGYERRYTPYGRVAHLLPDSGNYIVAACGVWTWSVNWSGSGSQDEYETAQELPTCKRCTVAVTP